MTTRLGRSVLPLARAQVDARVARPLPSPGSSARLGQTAVTWSRAMIRRMFALCLLLAFAAAAPAARGAESFTIGVMNDQSGPYADLAGPGSVEMARMAIEDFGGAVLGKPIELLVADHQNKVDVGLAIAPAMVRRARRAGDFRHHQFGRGARDPGSGQGPRPDCHLRLGLIVRPHRQGVLAERRPVERRQLVERGRADAAPDPAEARQLLLHHRRLRLRRFARGGRARRHRQGRRNRRRRGALARSTPPISALF